MRSISFFSLAASSRSSLLAFTTPMGSMKKVEPLEDTSWTRPGMAFLCSAFTGTTYRSERMVMMDSWRYLDWLEDVYKRQTMEEALELKDLIDQHTWED